MDRTYPTTRDFWACFLRGVAGLPLALPYLWFMLFYGMQAMEQAPLMSMGFCLAAVIFVGPSALFFKEAWEVRSELVRRGQTPS